MKLALPLAASVFLCAKRKKNLQQCALLGIFFRDYLFCSWTELSQISYEQQEVFL